MKIYRPRQIIGLDKLVSLKILHLQGTHRDIETILRKLTLLKSLTLWENYSPFDIPNLLSLKNLCLYACCAVNVFSDNLENVKIEKNRTTLKLESKVLRNITLINNPILVSYRKNQNLTVMVKQQ